MVILLYWLYTKGRLYYGGKKGDGRKDCATLALTWDACMNKHGIRIDSKRTSYKAR